MVIPDLIEQRDNRLWFKINGAMRHAIVRGAINAIGRPVVVTEYPKSGGTWLSQMLGAALGIPYPRNRLPHLRRQIIHGCYRRVHPAADTIVVWRDGRDTMVSFYYHLVFEKPITSARFSQRLNAILGITDRYDIQANLPRFIEWTFEGGYPGYSWSTFAQEWKDSPNIVETSYERVNRDPLGELKRVLGELGYGARCNADLTSIVEQYSFENQSNRKPGDEDVTSFARKGIVGDWKNVFTREACEAFDYYAGKELLLLGYEKDRSWVERADKHQPNEALTSLPQ